MWALLLFLVIAITIIIERLLYFYSTYVPFESFCANEKLRLTEGARDERRKESRDEGRDEGNDEGGAESHAEGRDDSHRTIWLRLDPHLPYAEQRRENSAYRQIAETYRKRWEAPAENRNSAVERVGNELVARMERRMAGLSIIAAVAPLVGLLGTILGMMQTFQQIYAQGGQADIGQLAGGIWTALLTTAFGLIVAIPSHLMYNLLRSILSRRVHRMNAIVQYLEESRTIKRSALQ